MTNEYIYTDDPCGWCNGTGRAFAGPSDRIECECFGCNGSGKRRDYRAEAAARHAARGLCTAVIRHGPGRQSYSFCELTAGHSLDQISHRVTCDVWEWDNDEAVVDDFGQVHER